MDKSKQSYDHNNPNWEHRGMLAFWSLHEVWLLCREQVDKLLAKNKISAERHTQLLKKFDMLYEEGSSREIRTSTDIMLVESDVRVMMFMLNDLGVDAMKEMLKLFDEKDG